MESNVRDLTLVLLLSLILIGCQSTEGNINYGLNHYQMGLYNQAVPSLNSSVEELEKQNPSDQRVTRAYLALGVMAQAGKLFDRAEQYMEKALYTAKHTEKNKNTHIRNAHNTLGNFYINQEKFKLALPHLEKALLISEATNHDPVLVAIDIDNIAIVYSELRDHEKSLEFSEKALESNEMSPDNKYYLRTKGVILFNRGKTYEELKQYKLALINYEESIKLLTELVIKQPHESWRIEIVEKAKNLVLGANKI